MLIRLIGICSIGSMLFHVIIHGHTSYANYQFKIYFDRRASKSVHLNACQRWSAVGVTHAWHSTPSERHATSRWSRCRVYDRIFPFDNVNSEHHRFK